MQTYELYKDIAERTQGDMYIGVVGPVRSGKSTFIQRFMEKLVIPGIENTYVKTRVLDELPQSGSGRTIMTTQPVFVPNESVEISLPEGSKIRLKLIDSVGYLVEGALGTQEGEELRMVHTPWAAEAIPFEQAAEIGTKKVIGEHSTIGLLITTDGSVTELPRDAYISAERRVADELKLQGKPFAIILNTATPEAQLTQKLRAELEREYGAPVIALDIHQIDENDIKTLLERILEQFPVSEIRIQLPEWLGALDSKHWLIQDLESSLQEAAPPTLIMKDCAEFISSLSSNQYVDSMLIRSIRHGSGVINVTGALAEGLFNQILAEQCGTEIRSDAHLLSLLRELVAAKTEYDHVSAALEAVRQTGYGLVPPKLEELTLQEPEIIKHGGKFGVKLRASAPSLHLIRVDIQTEVSPVVGTEQQSEEMIRYLMDGFEQDPQKLWQSNLFGKPLSDLVREGLANKLMHMPAQTQLKVQQTLEKIINEGTGGMVCILL